jgi:MFS family permease
MNSSSISLKKNGSMLCSLYSLGFFGMASMGIIFPTITLYALRLGANELEIGLIQGFFSTIIVFTMVPFGYLSDSYGRKKFISFAFIVALISFVSYAFVRNIPQLILVRGFHGLFISSFYPSAYAMAIALSNSKNRGTTLGLFSLATGLGFTLGNFLSGILIEKFSFKTTFYFCGFLAFVGLFIIFTRLNSYSKSFEAKESLKIKSKLIKSKRLIFLLLIPLIAFYSYGATYAFFPLYGKSFGLTDSIIGFYLASYSIASSLMSIFSGKIIDKFGSLVGIASGLIIGGIAYLLLFFSKENFLMLIALIIAGISNSLTYLSSQTFLTNEFSISIMGSAIGIFSLFLHIGMATGPIVTGIIASLFGLPFGFLLCSFLMFIALFGIGLLRS